MSKEAEENFSLVSLKIDLKKVNKSFGLGIRSQGKKIIVASVKPGSIAADYFKLEDLIVSINEKPITTKSVCRSMILSSRDTVLDIIVQRKSTNLEQEQQPPAPDEVKRKSVDMKQYTGLPNDIQNILKKQLVNIKKEGLKESKRSPQDHKGEISHISFLEDVKQHEIGSDVLPGKILRKPPPL